jgi:hypothetical protein
MLQAVPPPPRPAGRVTSYHNLPQTTSTPVRFSGPIEVYSALNLNSQQDPQSPTTEEEESMSPSDSNDEEFDIQQKDLQLPQSSCYSKPSLAVTGTIANMYIQFIFSLILLLHLLSQRPNVIKAFFPHVMHEVF